ncbi:hypothetical protein [Methylibium sp.]|uniref:hypothetical protein n=1 Tax=Methylibium sp. TaxID=2067992 RepID=UPI003D0FFB13
MVVLLRVDFMAARSRQAGVGKACTKKLNHMLCGQATAPAVNMERRAQSNQIPKRRALEHGEDGLAQAEGVTDLERHTRLPGGGGKRDLPSAVRSCLASLNQKAWVSHRAAIG